MTILCSPRIKLHNYSETSCLNQIYTYDLNDDNDNDEDDDASDKMLSKYMLFENWASSWDYGTYHIGD